MSDERVVLWVADDLGSRPTRVPGLVVAGSPIGEYGLSAAGTEDHRPLSLADAAGLLGCSASDVRWVASDMGMIVAPDGSAVTMVSVRDRLAAESG